MCVHVHVGSASLPVYIHVLVLQSELNIVASFDRRGERIVTGSSKGKVHLHNNNIVNMQTLPFLLYRF